MAIGIHSGYDAEYFAKEMEKMEAALAEAAAEGLSGAAAYYTHAAGVWEPKGRWVGQGARDIGLTGDVTTGQFRAVYGARVAPDGTKLGETHMFSKAAMRSREKAYERITPEMTAEEKRKIVMEQAAIDGVPHPVSYHDVTFSVPKDISVLWMATLADAERARAAGADALAVQLDAEAAAIQGAVDAGADAVLQRMEADTYVRTGKNGAQWHRAKGLIAASMQQFTSRAGDPQLHVHLAVANAAQRADGADTKWRTLDAQQFYGGSGRGDSYWAKHADGIAQEAMRAHIEAHVPGVHLRLNRDGTGYGVDGMARELPDGFSSRTVHIDDATAQLREKFVSEKGREPNRRELMKLRDHATLLTREAKPDHAVTQAEAIAQWEETARHIEGQQLRHVRDDVHAAAAAAAPVVHLDADERARVMQAALATVQREHSTWTPDHLWAAMWAISHNLPEAGREQLIDEMTAEIVGSHDVYNLAAKSTLDLSPLGLRQDGTPASVKPYGDRYCTAGQLDLESYLIKAGSRRMAPIMSAERAAELIAGDSLSGDQRQAVIGMASSGKAVDLLTGPAGSGKTTTLNVFRRIVEEETGRRVIGVAPSSVAAQQMREAGLTDVHNLADFLGKIEGSDETRGHLPIGCGEVLILDEAGMTALREMADTEQITRRNGAYLLMVGDEMQLDAPEAGGGFRLLKNSHGSHELTTLWRFKEEWEGPATLQLREGDASAEQEYADRGRITEGATAEVQEAAASAWLADYLAGKDSLLVTRSNDAASELAARVRSSLIGEGRVSERPEIVLGRDGNEASTGDLIMVRQNDRHIDAGGGMTLMNRHVLRFHGINRIGRAVVERETGDGMSEMFTLPPGYLQKHGQLAYAGNTHVAQGRTVDTSHKVQVPGDSRADDYVARSRGREANNVYTATDMPGKSELDGPMAEAGDRVRERITGRESGDLTATEYIRQEQDRTEAMPFLVDVLRQATAKANEAAAEELLRERLGADGYERFSTDPERYLVHRRIRDLQLNGHDLGEALTEATGRDFEGARSVAGVIHGRLRRLGGEQQAGLASWQGVTPEVKDPALGELARAAAAKADERTAWLGEQAAADRPAWAVRAFGDVPDGRLEREDWVQRVAPVAAYRELTGIAGPDQVIGDPPSAGNAEWSAAWRQAARALGLSGRPDGELHADVLAGERAGPWAPPDTSAELQDMRRAAADVQEGAGLAEGAELQESYSALATQICVRETELEAAQQRRTEWDTTMAPVTDAAAGAEAELARREALTGASRDQAPADVAGMLPDLEEQGRDRFAEASAAYWADMADYEHAAAAQAAWLGRESEAGPELAVDDELELE